ncbi:branched-chain amino acid ABC transporter permease [Candidatus Formimonas warabiya]|uniref:Branched-chain amino acid ABC transporter permease n=1 Tax=Formimonas warabiya TaxID=1761012 RepID=A0A3G1KZF7_FORW1|nr:branched-chain amino acid ABC transporter permease [Candidatus Formimonas warabiya]ATW27902.1 branched-chain amino acid ABC transporter permease [Candidatus Formimonas warabiya]
MFTQQLINGMMLGSVYALIALGYTMVYGVLKFINFAHGDVFMWGAFIGLFLCKVPGFNFPIVLIFTLIFSAIFGILVERIAYRPLRNAPRLVVTTSALGMSIVLSNLARLLIGSETYPVPKILHVNTIAIGNNAVINTLQLIVLGTALILMIGLNWFINKTRYGKAMRAASENKEIAGIMGISIDHVIALTFGIGSALGGAAGLLVGMYYDAVYATMGYSAGLKAFTAAILGGIGSIPGAMVGGVALGLVENFGATYLASGYRDAIAFGVLILVLLFKPSGLFSANIYDKRA